MNLTKSYFVLKLQVVLQKKSKWNWTKLLKTRILNSSQTDSPGRSLDYNNKLDPLIFDLRKHLMKIPSVSRLEFSSNTFKYRNSWIFYFTTNYKKFSLGTISTVSKILLRRTSAKFNLERIVCFLSRVFVAALEYNLVIFWQYWLQ